MILGFVSAQVLVNQGCELPLTVQLEGFLTGGLCFRDDLQRQVVQRRRDDVCSQGGAWSTLNARLVPKPLSDHPRFAMRVLLWSLLLRRCCGLCDLDMGENCDERDPSHDVA